KEDRARTAHAVLAADVRTGETEILAQEIAEQQARLDRALVPLAVHDAIDRGGHEGVGLLHGQTYDRLRCETAGQERDATQVSMWDAEHDVQEARPFSSRETSNEANEGAADRVAVVAGARARGDSVRDDRRVVLAQVAGPTGRLRTAVVHSVA